MHISDSDIPNELRWILAMRIYHVAPWFIFRERNEYAFASTAFHNEDVRHRSVLTFARRHDCDDFAGLEIVDGSILSNVIYFHPVFGSSTSPVPEPRTWDIVCGEFHDVFAFLANVVIPAMRDHAAVEDASNIEYDWRAT